MVAMGSVALVLFAQWFVMVGALSSFSSSVYDATSFPQFWNVAESESPPLDVSAYGFRNRSRTQVGNSCSTPGCKSWTQGLFPTIDNKGSLKNGGVPQSANLSAHLAEIEATLPLWIPDRNWDGNAVLDFEAWTTVWEQNVGSGDWHSKRYQDESLRLIKVQHPDWTTSMIESAAKEAFESSAKEWFVQTLLLCRKIRPRAKWGFYGLPENWSSKCTAGNVTTAGCGYDGKNSSEIRAQAENTQLDIWKASSALFPSIYLPDNFRGNPHATVAYIKSTVGEAMRCAAKAAAHGGETVPIPVFPYAWDHYHAGLDRLPEDEIVSCIQTSHDEGAAGVVWWGGSKQEENASYWKWFSSVEGPAVKAWCDANEC